MSQTNIAARRRDMDTRKAAVDAMEKLCSFLEKDLASGGGWNVAVLHQAAKEMILRLKANIQCQNEQRQNFLDSAEIRRTERERCIKIAEKLLHSCDDRGCTVLDSLVDAIRSGK